MNRYFIVSTLVISITVQSKAQDLINPYMIREEGTFQAQTQNVNYKEQLSDYDFETITPFVSSSGGYLGEYMIALKYHPWHGYYNFGSYNNGYTPFASYTKTYKMEVVSFPFTINCYDGPNGCADPIGTLPPFVRNLSMPDNNHPYDPVNQYWASNIANGVNVTNIDANGCFLEYMSGQCTNGLPNTLISLAFMSPNPLTTLNTQPRSYLPHTAIKHTVYLHCPQTNDVVTQFSWIYPHW